MEFHRTSGEREERGKCSLVHAYLDSEPWDVPTPRNLGEIVTWQNALATARGMLSGSTQPLVFLTGDCSREAQKAGVTLARSIHASVDTPASAFGFSAPFAASDPGLVTTTLGEAIYEADTILFWGGHPEENMPLLLEHLGEGAARRILHVYYGDRIPTADSIQLDEGETIPFLERLRRSCREKVDTGHEPRINLLKDILLSSKYGVVFIGDGLLREGRLALAELYRVAGETGNGAHWYTLNLTNQGNAAGAAEALMRETGHSHSIQFSETGWRHVPEYDGAEAMLTKGETDLAIFVGAPNGISKETKKALDKIRSITFSDRPPQFPTLWLPVGKTGIHTPGSMTRFDGVVIGFEIDQSGEWLSAQEVIDAVIEGKVKP